MTNLIKAELFKLKRNRTFWVLIITLTGLSVLLHALILTDWWQLTGTPFNRSNLSEMNALSVLLMPLIFNLIVSTLAGFYISTEFSQHSVIKNQIISGHKRAYIFIAKFLTFSLGSIIVTILIPLFSAIAMVLLFGNDDPISQSSLLYLGRVFGLFLLHFLCFTALTLVISVITEDSGKTILFTLLLTVLMFIIEKFVTSKMIKVLYENTFFYQFSEVFKVHITNGEILKSILIGVLSFFIIMFSGIYILNRKEIQ